jgi:arylformamidase
VADYQARSNVARAAFGDRVETLPGGSLLVRAHDDGPLLVFIHGGYWQALSAADSLYLAPGALSAGWSYAAVEYTIAPAGSLEQMVAECAAALGELAARGPWSSVVLAGHSAGAHLAAMSSIAALSPLRVDRVVLISGVFDLRPLVHTSVNAPLGLTADTASALSPALLPVVGAPDTVVTWAQDDTDAFATQSRAMAAHLRTVGVRVRELECCQRHHFDIVDDLVDPAHPLGAAALHFDGGHP